MASVAHVKFAKSLAHIKTKLSNISLSQIKQTKLQTMHLQDQKTKQKTQHLDNNTLPLQRPSVGLQCGTFILSHVKHLTSWPFMAIIAGARAAAFFVFLLLAELRDYVINGGRNKLMPPWQWTQSRKRLPHGQLGSGNHANPQGCDHGFHETLRWEMRQQITHTASSSYS